MTSKFTIDCVKCKQIMYIVKGPLPEVGQRILADRVTTASGGVVHPGNRIECRSCGERYSLISVSMLTERKVH